MTQPTFNDAAPTLEEIAAGFVGLPTPPGMSAPAAVSAPIPAQEPAQAPSAPRWLTEKKRIESYHLEYPFEFGGVEYRTIMIRRLTAGEVAAFMAKMRAEPDANHRFPMYFVGEAPIPDAVWDALDDDDRFGVTEIGKDFLPARFRAAPGA